MSWTTEQRVAVAATVLLVAAVPLLWQVGDVRVTQASADQQTALIENTVTTRQARTDYDGDGIGDATDRCPRRPETDNGYRDGDGCPDVVETTGAS
jgi:hypothetical protein